MNIFLSSVGRRSYMVEYFQNALSGKGKVFAGNSVITNALLKADDHILTPAIYDSSYIDFLLEYCLSHQIEVLISLFDIDLPILAGHRDSFTRIGVNLLVSSCESVDICNDKWKTYEFFRNLDLKQPRTYIDLNLAKSALNSGELQFPLFLKPRWGMGSIGIYCVENIEELDVLYQKLSKDIFRTYLRFESMADQSACILIQGRMPGNEYGIEILNDLSGNYVTVFAKKKIAMRAGETDIAEIVDAAPFISIAKAISQKLKHIGILDVDCFVSEEKSIYPLEMNCRFGGQYPFTHLAGVDVPLQIIKWVEGFDSDYSLLTPKVGLKACKDMLPLVMKD
jgi:carbamoyl-phosphate synthase large subunit